jgi:hypothetical protein
VTVFEDAVLDLATPPSFYYPMNELSGDFVDRRGLHNLNIFPAGVIDRGQDTVIGNDLGGHSVYQDKASPMVKRANNAFYDAVSPAQFALMCAAELDGFSRTGQGFCLKAGSYGLTDNLTTLQFQVTGTPHGGAVISPNGVMTPGGKRLLFGIFDAPAGKMQLWVNGVVVAEQAILTSQRVPYSPTEALCVGGQDVFGSTGIRKGRMHHLGIWLTGRPTDDEIRALTLLSMEDDRVDASRSVLAVPWSRQFLDAGSRSEVKLSNASNAPIDVALGPVAAPKSGLRLMPGETQPVKGHQGEMACFYDGFQFGGKRLAFEEVAA